MRNTRKKPPPTPPVFHKPFPPWPEWHESRGAMKEELLKSVARPAQVFYAPFGLVVMNLALAAWFILVLLALGMGGYIWAPIVGFLVLHGVLVLVGKREPHIDSMLAARRQVNMKTKNMIKEGGNKFLP